MRVSTAELVVRKRLGGRVRVDDPVALAQNEDRMRQGCEKKIELDAPVQRDRKLCDALIAAHAATSMIS